MRRFSIVIYSVLALALAAGALLVWRGGPSKTTIAPAQQEGNRYGYFLSSWRASVMNDFPTFIEIYPEAARQSTDYAERLFMTEMLRGDEEAAKAAAANMLKERPSHVLAAIYLSYLSFKDGKYDEADKRLKNLGSTGNNFMVKILRAWTRAAMNDYDAALDLLENEADKRAFEKITTMHLGLLTAQVDNNIYASQMFEDAAGMPIDIFDLENIAGYHTAQKRPEKARRAVVEALAQSPSSISVAALLKRMDKGWNPPAIDTPRKGYAKALFDLSSLAFAVNKNQPSETYMFYLKMALDIAPDMEIARLMKAEAYRKAGRPDVYKTLTDQIPAAHHLKPIARMGWAQELLARGDRSGLNILKNMIKDNPTIMQPYIHLGDFYRKHGKYKKAIKWYSRGIDANASSALLPETKLVRAMAYELSDKEDLAQKDLEEAAAKSQLPELMNYYGYFLINRGTDVDKGLRFIQIALSAEPTNPYYLDSYGWAYYKKGDFTEALRLMEYAYALSPGNPVILSHLGDAYWETGRHAEAKFAWRKALANLDNNKFVEHLDESDLHSKLARE